MPAKKGLEEVSPKIFPPRRLGGAATHEGVRQYIADHGLDHGPWATEDTVTIEGEAPAGAQRSKRVGKHHPGPHVVRQHFGFALGHVSEIANPAKVHHQTRGIAPRGEKPMSERHDRRALTAERHVGAAQIADHRHPKPGGQRRRRADLQRAGVLRGGGRVPNGLSVHADHRGLAPSGERTHRRGVPARKRERELGDATEP